jgi:hypothetical protein
MANLRTMRRPEHEFLGQPAYVAECALHVIRLCTYVSILTFAARIVVIFIAKMALDEFSAR